MRRTIEEILAAVEISRRELEHCIEENWILPEREGETLAFDDIDLARLRLIAELRHDLAVNDEAVPLVLHLIDQLHLMQNCLDAVGQALQELPQEHRSSIERVMQRLLHRK
jgi:chaperone modulatory protein CbpM